MTTYYVDPVNGNDSNAGTSWGAAWKTLISGATAARLGQTDSDEIRIAKSPDPVSIGNVTWTVASLDLTISGLTNTNVDLCNSGWSAGLITPTFTTSYYRQGGTSVQSVLSSTNGKVCYKTITTADYSAFTRITFYINFGTAVNYTSGAAVQIRLCSDTAGDTAVNTFTLPSYYYPANYWVPITIDNVNALGSGIQSVALYTTSSVSNTIRIDNIQVIKSASDTTSLSLTDLIAKNDGTGQYYPICAIDGTSVRLCTWHNSASTANPASITYYRSINGTETVATVKRTPFATASDAPATATSTAIGAISYTNNTNWPEKKVYTGGYNTSSGEVDGETWFDGVTGYGYGVTQTNTSTGSMEVSNISAVRYYYNYILNYTEYMKFLNCNSVVGYRGLSINSGTATGNTKTIWIEFKWLLHPNWGNFAITSTSDILKMPHSADILVSVVNAQICETASGAGAAPFQFDKFKGKFKSTGTITFGTTGSVDNSANYVFQSIDSDMSYEFNNFIFGAQGAATQYGNGFGGVRSATNTPTYVKLNGRMGLYSYTSASDVAQFAYGLVTLPAGDRYPVTMVIEGGANAYFNLYQIRPAGTVVIKDCYIPYTSFTANSSGTSTRFNDITYIQNYNKTSGDNRVYQTYLQNSTTDYWQQQSSVTYTGTTAWKWTAPSAITDTRKMKIGTVVVKSGTQATITIRARSSASNLKAGIETSASTALADRLYATTSTTDTWELLTLTFTPADNALVDLYVYAAAIASTTGSVYFDDLQVSQA